MKKNVKNIFALLGVLLTLVPSILSIIITWLGDFDQYVWLFAKVISIHSLFLLPTLLGFTLYLIFTRGLKIKILTTVIIIIFQITSFFISTRFIDKKEDLYYLDRITSLENLSEEVLLDISINSLKEKDEYFYKNYQFWDFSKNKEMLYYLDTKSSYLNKCIGLAYRPNNKISDNIEGCGEVDSWELVNGFWYEWQTSSNITKSTYSPKDLLVNPNDDF